jgi:hypothetical protein
MFVVLRRRMKFGSGSGKEDLRGMRNQCIYPLSLPYNNTSLLILPRSFMLIIPHPPYKRNNHVMVLQAMLKQSISARQRRGIDVL